jgi:predicted nucleotidyltransferase component of viral defense system
MNKAALTHKVHTISQKTGLPFNTLLTHFFLETVLDKLVHTPYSEFLVFKGGFLLSNQLGISMRSTIDIDLLLKNRPLSEESVTEIAQDICSSSAVPEVRCSFVSIEPIRAQDEYGGFRAKILCRLENIRETIPLDFATGDPITPGPVEYAYKSLFYKNDIAIHSYNAETILAEKLETIYRLGLLNSRIKDYYDVFTLWSTQKESIDVVLLTQALQRTFQHRGTELNQENFLALLDEIKSDRTILSRWTNWKKKNSYAAWVEFSAVMQKITELVSSIVL